MLDPEPENRFAQFLCELHRALLRRIRKDGRELLAAVARRQVAWPPQGHPQQVSDRAQAGVAGRVSVGVVIGLEVVDIDDQQAQRRVVPAALRERPSERDVERSPVRQSRQSVLAGEIHQALVDVGQGGLGLLDLGDVGHQRQRAAIGRRAHPRSDPTPVPHLEVGFARFGEVGDGVADPRVDCAGRNARLIAALGRGAQDVFKPRAGNAHSALAGNIARYCSLHRTRPRLLVEHRQAVRHVLHGLVESPAAFRNLVLQPLAFGDVVIVGQEPDDGAGRGRAAGTFSVDDQTRAPPCREISCSIVSGSPAASTRSSSARKRRARSCGWKSKSVFPITDATSGAPS